MSEPERREPTRLAVAAAVMLPIAVIADLLLSSDTWWRAGAHAVNVVALVLVVTVFVQRTAYPHRQRSSPWARSAPGVDADVFWPYLPRRGYPSVPAWLLVVLLILGVGLLLGLYGLLEGSVP